MSQQPYARQPTIHGDRIVFVAEDDLWTITLGGDGVARRLTTALTSVGRPIFSPDGERLVFSGRDEGPAELHVMPSLGGPAERLTWTGGRGCRAYAWTADGGELLFGAGHEHPFSLSEVYRVSSAGGPIEKQPFDHASNLALGPNGRVALGRLTADSARWKRYRGGTAGTIWIDADGTGEFSRLTDLDGNLGHPMCIGDRVWFVSDHEGVGNLYSTDASGGDLKRHTSFKDFYVRWPAHDGETIVFTAGARLYVHDLASDATREVEVSLNSPRVQRRKKFITVGKYLESCDLHPKGHALAVTARGRSWTFPLWERSVRRYETGTGRQRLATWLNDGESIALITDESGEERLAIGDKRGKVEVLLPEEDMGRAVTLAASPTDNRLLLTNHRNELWIIDIDEKSARLADRSEHSRITGPVWSPDGRWIAYAFPASSSQIEIRLAELDEEGTPHVKARTNPVLSDSAPSFSKDGRLLVFLSARVFNPVYDELHFSLGFPRGTVPCAVTLRADDPSPFDPMPRAPGEPFKFGRPDEAEDDKDASAEPEASDKNDGDDKKKDTPPEVRVDAEGFAERVMAFPVDEGIYHQIGAADGGKVLYTRSPVKGSLGQGWGAGAPPADRALKCWDFGEGKEKEISGGITAFDLDPTGKILLIRKGNRLRVNKLADKLPKESGTGRASGWIDLDRIPCEVDPPREWAQMLREAWRLQRDQFWDPNMTNIDWTAVLERYRPLLDRVATRAEFSDLVWELQGELGTSHAYEIGGDYRRTPRYPVGRLGADIRWDGQGWKIEHICRGDSWREGADSPLRAPGVKAREGEYIVEVDGRPTSREDSPAALLLNLAGSHIELGLAADAAGKDQHDELICTVSDETEMRYREWVDTNRRIVHEQTNGKIGYLHIPDMGPEGFSEFFRGFLTEVERQGLIVDARFNRGGHVSQLLLEKLARKRLGYDLQRHGKPEPFPAYTVPGPIVALTNEYAGSDGDIFSHSFKLMELGPLIGKRTWGGVIGIWPRHRLADGTITTQPEFSFWFKDVGFRVENYGTDPTIEVEIPPHETSDPQLDRAIAEALAELEKNPVAMPDFSVKPDLSPPKLDW